MTPAPPIDRRTAVDVARQLRTLLKAYAPGWKGGPGDFGDALVGIFARFAEIVIERLNRTPDKNLLAYLDLLGIALLPPQPARVPLTFSLAAGSATDGVVPAATQVTAPPTEGETAPLIFETEHELVVIAAALDKVFARDPGGDRFADLSDLATATVSGARRAFTGSMPFDHSPTADVTPLVPLGEADAEETARRDRSVDRNLPDAPPALERTAAGIATFFDPYKTPTDFLPWLASWTAFSLRADLEPAQQRDFIAKIIPLYRGRGTKGNLEQLLSIFTIGQPTVTESSAAKEPHLFSVTVRLVRLAPEVQLRQLAIVRALVDLEKPAHTDFELKPDFPSMQIGRFSTVGVDTLLGTADEKSGATA